MGIRLQLADTRAKRALLDKVRSRAASGLCLIEGCDCEATARGLCRSHYQNFCYERASRPRVKRERFERIAIKRGLILAPGECRFIKSVRHFANVG